MRTVSSNNTTVLPLGKQGETLAEKIIFTDPISWLKGYGPGTVQLLNQRPGEDTPYPVVISEESDGSYSWAVTAADTALTGQGKCELRYLSGDTVVKSHIWSTIVNDALGEPSDTPPESQQGWVDKVLQAGTDAQEAAKRAEDAAVRQPYPNAETGTWWVWDAENGAYKDTGISCGGSGGSSVELDATLTKAGKAADAKAVGDALSTLSEEITGCIKSPASAQVGQTIVVKAVDEYGKPTEWEAADMASGGDSGVGIHMITRVVTEANAASIEVTGLSTTAEVLSLRIYNPGPTCGNGLRIAVNGVQVAGYQGTIAGASTVQALVRAWLYRDGGKLYGRAYMANDGTNVYEWTERGEITSIAIDSVYNDGTTKYFQTGTIFEIYEGVYPNVK